MNNTHITPLGWFAVLLVVFSVAAVSLAAGAAATRPHAAEWRCVTVQGGDTLWRLAQASSDGDTREVVHRVVRENRLDGGVIVPGMAIWLPRERDAELAEVDSALCSQPD